MSPPMLSRMPPVYSRAENVSDAIIHTSGIALALIGGPILVTLAALWTGSIAVVTATAIYALCLLAMLAASALYNMSPRGRWDDRLRRLDQSAIFLKIAGTYTPFVALAGSEAGWFLGALWLIAAAGVTLILFGPRRMVVSIGLYLTLGWAGALWSGPLLVHLSAPVLWLLLTGGILYTVGIAFLLWQRLPFHNTIWHVFVLAATAICYAAIVVELAYRSGLGLSLTP